ncbi:MAG: hypothetical protein WCF84_14410 [Anaerolineae bacterium]
MRENGILISGAAGILLAALIYFLSIPMGGLLRFLVLSDAEFYVFVVLFAVALVEMPVMVLALRVMRSRRMPPFLVYGANAGYVAFAAVYALIQVAFFGESTWSMVLVALCIVRWASDLLLTHVLREV